MARMIICCGEALIDMLPRQLSGGEDVFLPVPGGAIFNTAIALGRLGEETAFVSGVSTDMFGDQLIEALGASKVDPSFCVRLSRPTTLAFVKLTDGHASYSFFDENSAGRSVSLDDLPDLPGIIDAMHFGAISLIPEPCGSAYEALMSRYASQTVISLDPNIRPGFIEDADAHRSRLNRMIAMADIVKVSDEDLDWLAGDRDGENLIGEWLSDATSVVLLTKGADGVTAYNGTEELHQPAEMVEVIDTVGAGDTFNAGFLSGLKSVSLLSKPALSHARLEDVQPALAFAGKVAAFVVGQAGAVPPWRDEIEKT